MVWPRRDNSAVMRDPACPESPMTATFISFSVIVPNRYQLTIGQQMAHSSSQVKKAPAPHQVSRPKPGDPYKADCPTRMALDRIADKWTVLVLVLLDEEPMRFNQLRR